MASRGPALCLVSLPHSFHPRSPSAVNGLGTAPTSTAAPSRSFFPKQGQTLELVCESLAFKGKGVCKVADTGFVLMCDRALPGERFLGRVSGKKGNYAKMEFSFGAQRWIPGDPLTNDQDQIESGYALGLHAPSVVAKPPSLKRQVKSRIRQPVRSVGLCGRWWLPN